jgi:uncharacterized protein YdhG (YjbR/CyaY superfamily)
MAAANVDEYIAGFSGDARNILQEARERFRKLFPAAEESMNYGVPTLSLNGRKVNYAAFKHHFGIYPSPDVIENFRDELEGYPTSKGTVRFPFDKPVPWDLIQRIVKYRLIES